MRPTVNFGPYSDSNVPSNHVIEEEMTSATQLCRSMFNDYIAFAPQSVSGPDDDMTSQRVTDIMSMGNDNGDTTVSGCPTCNLCGQLIVDRYFLLALGTSWHVGCLTCQDCSKPLDSQMTCFTRDGKIYCRDDYYRLFVRQPCSRCLGPVSAHELVMFARQHVYHVECFVCIVCQRQLTTGQHYGMHRGAIYCQMHYELVAGSRSPGDNIASPARHPTVVTPSEYSSNDEYERVMAGVADIQQVSVTSVCNEVGLSASGPRGDSLSMALSPPPAYTLLEGHRTTPIRQVAGQSTPDTTRRNTPHEQAPFYGGGAGLSTHKGRPRKRCKITLRGGDCSSPPTSDSDPYTTSNFSDVSFGDMVGCDLDLLRHGGMAAYTRLKDGGGINGNMCGRQKRLRTSFKHHQLRSMKAYFALNHNPDAKDLKELAQKTGLTKRVLQVWFQNARAKYRRNTLKQEQQDRNQIHQVAPADSSASASSVAATGVVDKPSSRALLVNSPGPQHGTGRPSAMTSGGHQCGYPMSRSPASLSDVSSTQSSCNDMMNSGLSNDLDLDSSAGVKDSLTIFQSSNYLIEKLP